MQKLIYYKSADEYLCLFSPIAASECTAELYGVDSATLIIGRQRFHVKDGKTKIVARKIEDGAYTPLLALSDKTYRLPGLCVKYGLLSSSEVDDNFTRALKHSLLGLCQRVEALEKRCCELYELIVGKPILYRTRKEKKNEKDTVYSYLGMPCILSSWGECLRRE